MDSEAWKGVVGVMLKNPSSKKDLLEQCLIQEKAEEIWNKEEDFWWGYLKESKEV